MKRISVFVLNLLMFGLEGIKAKNNKTILQQIKTQNLINEDNYISEQNLQNLKSTFVQDGEDLEKDDQGSWEQPQVTFGDPNFTVKALYEKESTEQNTNEVKQPEMALSEQTQEPESLAEAEAGSDTVSQSQDGGAKDDDDEHEHDDWNDQIFKSTGMPNHTSEHVKQDLALIKKHILKAGTGETCLPDDWASIHWTARIRGTKEIVEDSRKFFGAKKPKTFIIGHFDKIKCFDLIVAQMKSGESSTVMCPSQFVYGGTPTYGHFGSVQIPPNSDITYTIDVISCTPSKVKGHVFKKAVPLKSIVQQKKDVESAKGLVKLLKSQVEKLQVSLSEAEIMSNAEHKESLQQVENPEPLGEKDHDEEDTQTAIVEKQNKLLATKSKLKQIKKAAKAAQDLIDTEEAVVVATGKAKATPPAPPMTYDEPIPEDNHDDDDHHEEEKGAEEEQEDHPEEQIAKEAPAPAAPIPKIKKTPIVVVPKKKIKKQKPPKKVVLKPKSKEVEQIEQLKAGGKLDVSLPGGEESPSTDNGDEKTKIAIAQKVKDVQEKVIVKQVTRTATKAIVNIDKLVKDTKKLVETFKPLKPGKCFYIHSLGEDGHTDSDLVLEASTVDKYAPRKTGVYNISLKKKVKGKKAQQWTWEDNQRLTPMLYKGKALFEGMNKNLIIYKFRKMKQQKFEYDEVNKIFVESFTKNVLGADEKNLVDNSNVVTEPYIKSHSEKWKPVYCDE